MSLEMVAVFCTVGEPRDIAAQLRNLAEMVEQFQGAPAGGIEIASEGWPRAIVRAMPAGSGEEALVPSRMWAVIETDGHAPEPLAILATEDEARGYIALSRTSHDLIAVRADVVGTIWNSFGKDPHQESGRFVPEDGR